MLRKSNKDFCKSLKRLCIEDSTLNPTLKKYFQLKKRLKRFELALKFEEDKEIFFTHIHKFISEYIENKMSLGECCLLLAIFANSKQLNKILSIECDTVDFGLSSVLFEKFLKF